jgi:hypothetical protein
VGATNKVNGGRPPTARSKRIVSDCYLDGQEQPDTINTINLLTLCPIRGIKHRSVHLSMAYDAFWDEVDHML